MRVLLAHDANPSTVYKDPRAYVPREYDHGRDVGPSIDRAWWGRRDGDQPLHTLARLQAHTPHALELTDAEECVMLLLEAGADPCALTPEGQSVADVAVADLCANDQESLLALETGDAPLCAPPRAEVEEAERKNREDEVGRVLNSMVSFVCQFHGQLSRPGEQVNAEAECEGLLIEEPARGDDEYDEWNEDSDECDSEGDDEYDRWVARWRAAGPQERSAMRQQRIAEGLQRGLDEKAALSYIREGPFNLVPPKHHVYDPTEARTQQKLKVIMLLRKAAGVSLCSAGASHGASPVAKGGSSSVAAGAAGAAGEAPALTVDRGAGVTGTGSSKALGKRKLTDESATTPVEKRVLSAADAANPMGTVAAAQWACTQCTLVNARTSQRCAVCESPREVPAGASNATAGGSAARAIVLE